MQTQWQPIMRANFVENPPWQRKRWRAPTIFHPPAKTCRVVVSYLLACVHLDWSEKDAKYLYWHTVGVIQAVDPWRYIGGGLDVLVIMGIPRWYYTLYLPFVLYYMWPLFDKIGQDVTSYLKWGPIPEPNDIRYGKGKYKNTPTNMRPSKKNKHKGRPKISAR